MRGKYFLLLFFASAIGLQGLGNRGGVESFSVSQTCCMAGDTVWLAYDADLCEKTESVKWFSSINGTIGHGYSLAVNDLSAGTHKIWVELDDSACYEYSDSILIKPYRPSDSIKKLVQWMTGYFSSQAQADTSTDKYHVDVRLRMRRIWPDSSRSYWIYVEQAYAEDTAQPYRQRVYEVYEANGQIRDNVYKIAGDSLFVYAWQYPEKFHNLSKDDLELKPCCGMYFDWHPENHLFIASTSGRECKAGIPGVSYITSESKILPNQFTSWDLGYNKKGEIVMGPHSPYIFEKRYNYCIE